MNRSSFNEQDGPFLPSYKIIIVGMSSVGKTKLLSRYIYDNYVDSSMPTAIDCSILKKAKARYVYYDTAGQEVYRSMLGLYFKGADAALLVYNVNEMKSFEELEYYRRRLEETAPNCTLYLVGCKNDLPSSVDKQLVARIYPNIKHFITSAKQNKGVNETFLEIQQHLLNKKKTNEGSSMLKPMMIKDGKERAKKQCCA